MKSSIRPGTEIRDSSSALQASRDLRVAFRRIRRRMRDVATDDELSMGQVSVLTRLGKDGASTASALAVLEGVRPQSMAATITSLEELGLVRRCQDPEDGRRLIVTLSDAGRDRDGISRALSREWLATAMLKELTEAERQTIIAAMALVERLAQV